MALRNTTTSYGSVAKFFHWLISPLVILMLIAGYFLEDIPKDYQPLTYNIHKMTGITILFLMILRMFWALVNVKPGLPGSNTIERMAAKLMHYALYICVILMPLAGWVGSVAAGRPPHLGDFMFNLPIAPDKALAESAFDVHGTVAIILIVLIVLHVLAALYHHYIKRDDILVRMLPGSRKR